MGAFKDSIFYDSITVSNIDIKNAVVLSTSAKLKVRKSDGGVATISFPLKDGTVALTTDVTHYTTHLYVGASGAATNAVTSNGSTYLKLYDDSTSRASFKISGSRNVAVASDASGNITITGPDLSGYMPKSGGQFTGRVSWNSTSLPAQDDASYFVTIEPFASGGKMYYTTIGKVKTALGIPTIPNITVTDNGSGTFVTDVTSSGHTITLSRGNVPQATTSVFGGIKAIAVRSTDLTTFVSGGTTGSYYGVELDSGGQAFVNLPDVERTTNGYRLKNSSNYGFKLNFGDGDYVYLQEDTDDHLKIYAKSGVNFSFASGSLTVDSQYAGPISIVGYSDLATDGS